MDDIKKFLKRYYTKALTENTNLTVYDLFEWKKVDVFIKDYKTNTVLVDMKDLEFPKDYSQNACDIIASKYFKKALVPNEVGYENSLKMIVHRIVNFWCDALVDEGLINNEDEKEIFILTHGHNNGPIS